MVLTLTFEKNAAEPGEPLLAVIGSQHQRISHSLSAAALAMKLGENHAGDIPQLAHHIAVCHGFRCFIFILSPDFIVVLALVASQVDSGRMRNDRIL